MAAFSGGVRNSGERKQDPGREWGLPAPVPNALLTLHRSAHTSSFIKVEASGFTFCALPKPPSQNWYWQSRKHHIKVKLPISAWRCWAVDRNWEPHSTPLTSISQPARVPTPSTAWTQLHGSSEQAKSQTNRDASYGILPLSGLSPGMTKHDS